MVKTRIRLNNSGGNRKAEPYLTIQVCQRHSKTDIEENGKPKEYNNTYPIHVVIHKHAPCLKKNLSNCRFGKSWISVWLRKRETIRCIKIIKHEKNKIIIKIKNNSQYSISHPEIH